MPVSLSTDNCHNTIFHVSMVVHNNNQGSLLTYLRYLVCKEKNHIHQKNLKVNTK